MVTLEMKGLDAESYYLLPCPFCGEQEELDIVNTWTASYWVECPCGAEASGGTVEGAECGVRETEDPNQHAQAKHLAVEAWNRRVAGGS